MKKVIVVIVMLSLAIFFVAGCEPDYPDSVWDPDYQGKPDPIITGVEPDSALAGIDTVRIIGENFSPEVGENHVSFDGNKATTLSATDTVVTVLTPNVVGDSLRIQLRVDDAILFDYYYPYKLEPAVIEYGGFGDFDYVSGLACDLSENIYVLSQTEDVIKVTPEGEQIVHGTNIFITTPGMKIGLGGYLYILRGNKKVYRILPEGGSESSWVTLSGKVSDIDFDSNGILYAAGKGDSIYSIKSDGSFFGAAAYIDYNIISVRVYEPYVYVAGKYEGTDTTEGIWRNRIISSEGELDDNELVFDWGNYVGEDGPSILSITFSETGELYIGQDKEDAITIYSLATETTRILYPGILYPPATYMCWGNGDYLYVNRHDEEVVSKRRIMRINMKLKGAPYFGRQ
ncbi:IPT/TIG domain-containing protein [candidate division KSB1 bacterium]|nr:IPT/TIG domain-containing protein [candidate division KSB1 bacterium]